MLLNHNKRTDGKYFFKLYEKLLNIITIATELRYVERFNDRSKMEHVDKDVIYMLKKARSKAEVERK